MALPAEFNIEVYRGDYYALDVQVRQQLPDGTLGDPVDLTARTARAHIRERKIEKDDEPPIIAEFDIQVLNAQQGMLRMELLSSKTTQLPTTTVYDLEIWPDGDPERARTYLAGKIATTSQVTAGPVVEEPEPSG